MTICQYFLNGNCRFGNNCRNEHIYPNSNNSSFRNNNFKNKSNMQDAIKILNTDLNLEKPKWPFSSYITSNANNGGRTLLENFDVSPEELRYKYYVAQKTGQMQQYNMYIQEITQKINSSIQNILNNPEQALQGNLQPSNTFGQNSFGNSSTSTFGSTGFANKTNAFGNTSTPAFGSTGFGNKTTSAFGNTSTPAFGSTGFGANNTSAFGNTSTPAFGSTSFGKNNTSAFGNTSTSTFGSTSFGTNTTTSAFGSVGFNKTTSAFGNTSTPAFGSTGFGSNNTTSAFGNANKSAFGNNNNNNNNNTTSAFGSNNTTTSAFGNNNSTSAFGNNAFGNSSTSAFGSSSTSAFGNTNTVGGFSFLGNSNTNSAFGNSAFGNSNNMNYAAYYGDEKQLSQEQLKSYEEADFSFSTIPENPPPQKYC